MREVKQECIDLSRYRLARAKEDIATAERNYAAGDFRAANNRAYYAIFHALRSVLALDSFDSKKHSGIISEFRRRYIKEGVFPVEVSRVIEKAFEIRNNSDYDDMFIANKDETLNQIENAKYVISQVESYMEVSLTWNTH